MTDTQVGQTRTRALADVVREGVRDRHERLTLLADPECKRGCQGRGYANCNYVGAGKGYAEMVCPCTGAAPYQTPSLLLASIPYTREELAERPRPTTQEPNNA